MSAVISTTALPVRVSIPDISVVIPVYNEEASIAGAVRAPLPGPRLRCSRSYEIIFVNDGSRDHIGGGIAARTI